MQTLCRHMTMGRVMHFHPAIIPCDLVFSNIHDLDLKNIIYPRCCPRNIATYGRTAVQENVTAMKVSRLLRQHKTLPHLSETIPY